MWKNNFLSVGSMSFEKDKRMLLAVFSLLSIVMGWLYLSPVISSGSLQIWSLFVVFSNLSFLALNKLPISESFQQTLFASVVAFSLSSLVWLASNHSTAELSLFIAVLLLTFSCVAVAIFAKHFFQFMVFSGILLGHIGLYIVIQNSEGLIFQLLSLALLFICLGYLNFDLYAKIIKFDKLKEESRIRQKFLLEASSAAEFSSNSKSRFIVDMNNELKGRLKIIMNSAQMIIMSKLDKVQGKRAKTLVQNSKSLMRLVSQLQDINDIELGNINLKMKEVRLVDLISKSVNVVLPYAIQKKMLIDENYMEIDNVMVYVDTFRLNQILLNILSNAIKYNKDRGKISVTGKRISESRVKIEIKDSGKGIDDDHIGYIFDAFTKIEDTKHKNKGSGLGLHVAKAYTEAMGGEISAASVINYGSIFSIELDVSDVATNENQPISKAIALNQNVLIVDDSKVKRIVLTRQVQNIGNYSVSQVSNGHDALDEIGKKEYQLLLVDYWMPSLNGDDLCKKIKSLEQHKKLPIVVITSDKSESIKEKCLSSGADAVLVHPVNTQVLKSVISQFVNERALEKIKQSRANQGSLVYQQIKKNLESVFGDNVESKKKLFTSYLKSLKPECQKLINAQKTKNITEFKQAIAKIKWASKSIGAEQIVKVCITLENVSNDVDWLKLKKPVAYIVKYHKVLELEHNATSGNFLSPVPEIENLSFLAKTSVMLIDDDFFLLNYVKQVLENFGVSKIAIFTDANDALATIKGNKEQPYDLLISDLNMPAMDGIDFFRELGRIKFDKRIILMSGVSLEVRESAAKLSRSFGLDVIGSLGKPINSDELKTLLYKVDTDNKTIKKKLVTESFSKAELHEAIKNNEIVPYYQPKIDALSKQIHGFEALARWKKGSEIVSPITFIPQIEQYNLAKFMTEKIIDQVLIDCQTWIKTGHDFKISVNITIDLLEDNSFIEDLIKNVKQSNVPKGSIVVELTESAFFEDYFGALEGATRLRMAGFLLSIDDFGTGSATFEQLNKIPFTELKIDQTFVTGAHSDSSKQVVLESSLEIAKKLKLKTVAEGIETQQDLDLLYFLGCDYLQGYFFTAPLSKKKIDTWIKQWSKKNK